MTLGFLILGPFEVHVDGVPLVLGPRQQRALLAALTLRANELVSSERLIDELWPEDPPDTADHLVHVYVSRLRKALGEAGRTILVTRPPGYELLIERGQLDLHRFEDLVAAARRASDDGRFDEASDLLREALGLWRGPALADLVSESFARADAERLNEQRLSTTEDLMRSELAAGRADLVPELKSLVAQHPLRERLRGILMVALYREGRQAEALDEYEATRSILADQLGIDPSEELQELHRRVLMQDPTLRRAEPSRTTGHAADLIPLVRTRRRSTARVLGLMATGAGALVVAAILVVPRLMGDRPSRPSPLGTSRIAHLGDDAKMGDQITIGGNPSSLAVDGSIVWVADSGARTVTRLDTARQTSVGTGSVGIPQVIVAADGSCWVLDPFGGAIFRVDATGDVSTLKHLAAPVAAVYAFDSLWVVEAINEQVFRLDPMTGHTQARIALLADSGPAAISAGPSSIWVLNTLDRSISRIDPDSDRSDPDAIPLLCGSASSSCSPTDLAATADAVWVTIREGSIERFSMSGAVQRVIDDVLGPMEVAPNQSGAWVRMSGSAGLVRIDARGYVVERVRTVPPPVGVANDSGATWVLLAS